MQSAEVNDDIGLLLKANTLIGKAVDFLLKKVTFGEDPLDYQECLLDDQKKLEKANQLRNEAQNYFESANFNSAILYMKRVLELQPGLSPDVFNLLYYLCNSPVNFSEILTFSAKLNMNDIDDPRKVEVLAVIDYLEGKKAEAYDILKHTIENEAVFSSFGGNYITGIILQDTKPELAVKYFREAIQLYPDDVDAHQRLLKCYETIGDSTAVEVETYVLQILM